MKKKGTDFWNIPLTRSAVTSQNVKLPEMLFGYLLGPFGALLSSGIFTSILQNYFTDVLKLDLSFLTGLQLFGRERGRERQDPGFCCRHWCCPLQAC